MLKIQAALFTIAFSSLAFGGPITPTGTIGGVTLDGVSAGQSTPQPGEIAFTLQVGSGQRETVTGEVCAFGSLNCVSGSGGVFDPANPSLYVKFSVECGQANCGPVSYDLSATYALVGNDSASDSTSGLFQSSDIAGMNGSDAMSFLGLINGSDIGSVFDADPSAGIASYPFSNSVGPDMFVNGGNTVTAEMSGSFTDDGPEDVLNYSGEVDVTAASTPEPASFGSALIGLLSLAAFVRTNRSVR